MAPAATNKAKLMLFTAWVKAGETRVFFDSGFPGVEILDRLRNDPEMWIAVTAARVSSEGMKSTVGTPGEGNFEVYVPWGAVHTLESAALHEIHVWGDDLEAAEARKNNGYPKEMKN